MIKEVVLEVEKQNVEMFLGDFDLKLENNLDKTFYIEDNSCIVATVSVFQNIVKCLAVSNSYQGLDIASKLISKAINYIFDNDYDNIFVYTKPEYKSLFESLNFKVVMNIEDVCFLEYNSSIEKRLLEIKDEYNLNLDCYAALVVNCNPMTNGHLYLIEKCALENKNVIVFVVEEDLSEFKFNDRFDIVRNVCQKLKNVTVVPSSEYIISSKTFPTYFIKDEVDSDDVSIRLDLNIFKEYFVRIFNINVRYVGSEPNSVLTNKYNDEMKKILKDVVIVNRVCSDGEVISATTVRKLLLDNDYGKVKELLPKYSYEVVLEKYTKF